MAAPFKDSLHQSRFDQLGWTRGPFLHPADLAELRDGFARLGRRLSGGFHATMNSPDFGYRCDVYCMVRPIIERRVQRMLNGYRVCVANWVVKESGAADSTVDFHQDWSFVDERRMRSINLWIPIVDVDERNGCLELVSGSHRLSTDHRAHSDDCRFRELSSRLECGYKQSVPMRAGEGVFYDGALLHRSGNNSTAHRRAAVGVVLVPDGAPLLHCHRISPTAVEVFAVDDSFFWRHVPGTRPRGVSSLGVIASAQRQHSNGALGWLTPNEPVRSAA
jgi:hypothetical protein